MENHEVPPGDTSERRNLTDEQILQMIHGHREMMNILESYHQGTITDADLNRLVTEKTNPKNPEEV